MVIDIIDSKVHYITSNIDRSIDTLIRVKNYQIYTFLCLKDLSKTFYNYL